MDTSMSLETIVTVVVLAFTTYYGARWLLIAHARRSRRIAANLTDTEIDRLVERRDDDYEAWMFQKVVLLPRAVGVMVGIVITIGLALALNTLMSNPAAADAPGAGIAFIIGWIFVALNIVVCALAFVMLILRPLLLLIRVTEADQRLTEEMRAASLARRADAARKPRRRWFTRSTR